MTITAIQIDIYTDSYQRNPTQYHKNLQREPNPLNSGQYHAYREWCYGQDSNLRTPAGKDIPSGAQVKASRSWVLHLWPGLVTVAQVQYWRFGFRLINHLPRVKLFMLMVFDASYCTIPIVLQWQLQALYLLTIRLSGISSLPKLEWLVLLGWV